MGTESQELASKVNQLSGYLHLNKIPEVPLPSRKCPLRILAITQASREGPEVLALTYLLTY